MGLWLAFGWNGLLGVLRPGEVHVMDIGREREGMDRVRVRVCREKRDQGIVAFKVVCIASGVVVNAEQP